MKDTFEIETYLPAFDGFYNSWYETLFELTEDDVLCVPYNLGEKEKELVEFITMELRCACTPDSAYLDVVKSITEVVVDYINNELPGDLSVIAKDFELSSPKYYNFHNDHIDITFKCSKELLDWLKKYCIENYEFFKVFIYERYTSYDGFSSNYDNDLIEWLDNYDVNVIEDSHVLGTILEFFLGHRRVITKGPNSYTVSECVYMDVQEELYGCIQLYTDEDVNDAIKEANKEFNLDIKSLNELSDLLELSVQGK